VDVGLIGLGTMGLPIARNMARAGTRLVVSPKPAIAAPHAHAAIVTARPCLPTRDVQPEKSDPTSAPAYGAAYR